MNRRNLFLLLCVSAGVAACSDAKASMPDPSQDVDCSVLAFYFSGQAAHSQAAPEHRNATKLVHEWYAARIRKIAADRWGGIEGMNREVGPILEAVKRDPTAVTDSYRKCTDRAVKDPDFGSFAAKLGR